MDGILVVAHGSRRKETEETFNRVVDRVRRDLDVPVETAFMEFSERSIRWGLESLAGRGLKDILVLPYFLFEGMHIRKDIPEEIGEFSKEHPGVQVTLGDVLGDDPRLSGLLLDRIRQAR